MSTTKTYLSANQLLNDSFQLGTQIIKSGFKPTFIVGIWRGGAPVGIAVQEILAYAGIQTDNIAIGPRPTNRASTNKKAMLKSTA